MNGPLLEIRNLTKIFDDEAGREVILENVNLSVQKNDFLCILGPSGCGKTTLLRCIAGFETYEGDILVSGEVKREPGTDRIMVFQDFNQLFPWKTVEKNIQFPLQIQGLRDKKELKRISDNVLEKVRLSAYSKYYPYQLSGGMKQRVAIAKALALKPDIILMDEPFAALDAMTRRNLQEEVLRISNEEHCTIIFITHNIQEAIALSTRTLVFQHKGKIVYDEINRLEKPATPASRGFGEVWDALNQALHGKTIQKI